MAISRVVGESEHPELASSARFEVRRRLGEGSSGVVYEALDRESGARIALKTLTHVDANAVYAMKREFRALADVTHPNLVRLYELIVEGDVCLFTMELIDGVDLVTYLSAPRSRSDPDSYAIVRRTFAKLASVLAHLHDREKIHRDVKPSNVLVTPDGRVVLLDFGILADLKDRGDSEGDAILGTATYMAPEQAMMEALGPSADWYAMGVMLYEALTGELPFRGNAIDVMTEKQIRAPRPPSAIVPGIPADLDALCQELLRIDPASRPNGSAIRHRLSGTIHSSLPVGMLQTPLVGRAAMAVELARAFDRAKLGTASVVLVEGSSGMGKTAFVKQFLATLEGRGTLILEGRCFERESVPYKTFDEVIDALSRHLIELAPEEQALVVRRDAAALARLFPVLARVPAIADAPRRAGEGFDGQQLRRRAFAALRDTFAMLCARGPVVVFVDDVQWSDADGIALLREIAAPPSAPPVLFVLAFRSEDLDAAAPLKALLDAITGIGKIAVRIPLERLTPDEARDLAEDGLARGGLLEANVAGLAETVALESGGNPFFVGELVRLLVASRGEVRDVRIETVVRERIASLPEDARRLLRVVAVAGRPIERSVALRAAELRGAAALDALSHLQTSSLLRTRPSATGDDLESFHDRIRATACAAMSPRELADEHGRLARTLTEAGFVDPEVLLVHFLGSGNRAHAAELAVTAARRTAQALAFDRASQLFRTALELLPAEDERVHGLQIELADALTNAGRGAEAAEAYFAASASTTLQAEAIWLERRAAEELLYSGLVERGKATLAYVLSLHGMHFARARWQAIVRILALRIWLTIRGLSYTPRDPSQTAPNDLMRLDLLVSAATCLVMIDTIIGAPFATGNVVAALRVGEPWRICRALVVETCFLCTAGAPAEPRVTKYLAKARDVARIVSRADTDALVTATEGVAHYFRGEWKKAHERLSQGLAAYEDFIQPMAGARTMTGYNFSARWEMSTFRYFTLVALMHLGRVGELGHRLAAFARDAEDRGDLSAITNFRVGESNFYWLAQDEPARVEALVTQAMERWPRTVFLRQHWLALLATSQLELYRGTGPETLARIDEAWEPLKRSLLLRIQYFDLRAIHLRARAALACTRTGRAEDAPLLARSHRDGITLMNARARWAIPFGHLVLAAVAHQKRDDAQAHSAIDLAIAGFAGADMPLQEAAATHRKGGILGGDEGRALIAKARQTLESAGVHDAEKMTRMLAPGFSA